MGCHFSQDEELLVNREELHRTNTKTSTPIGTPVYLRNRPNQRTRTLRDFNVIYTDFVGEKKGNITDYYNILSPAIGTGSYGQVKKAVHKKTGVVRAVKIIDKLQTTKQERERLINEVHILKKLDHPNIMKIYEFYQDDSYFYIVSEFLTGGELFDKISSNGFFTEKKAAVIMKQILSAVRYCHINNIVHRDLKPENMLFESKERGAAIKLIDFGTSRFFDSTKFMHQRFGTPYYIAPEVLKNSYTEKCDVWSCGVIMYLILSGYPPFNANSDEDIFKMVAKGKFSFDYPEWEGISAQAKDLITKMLQLNVDSRLSAEQALHHPWFKTAIDTFKYDKPMAVETLNNLKRFRACRKLESTLWMYLVNYLASQEERAQLLQVFQALDLDGDGQLSKDELIKGYKELQLSDNPEIDVQEIMAIVDVNNSGALDYTEFVIASINRTNMLKKEKLEMMFECFDKDGDGFITADELKEALNPSKHEFIDDKVWNDLIKEFDQNGDGKISLAEFKDMMTRLV